MIWLVVGAGVSGALLAFLWMDRQSRIEAKCERERMKRYLRHNLNAWVDQEHALADEADRQVDEWRWRAS